MGYEPDYSMSERARAAYAAGLVPASKAARGVSAALVREFCQPEEWHHTSARYHRTDFFDPHLVRVAFGVEPACDDGTCGCELNERAVDALRARTAHPEPAVHEGCTVTWLEWAGTRRHPRVTEHTATGCTVTVVGSTAIVAFADGRTMRKRLATNGFSFRPAGPGVEH